MARKYISLYRRRTYPQFYPSAYVYRIFDIIIRGRYGLFNNHYCTSIRGRSAAQQTVLSSKYTAVIFFFFALARLFIDRNIVNGLWFFLNVFFALKEVFLTKKKKKNSSSSLVMPPNPNRNSDYNNRTIFVGTNRRIRGNGDFFLPYFLKIVLS